MVVFLNLIICLLVASAASYEYFPKFSEECDVWAGNDGECVNNASFMWSKCLRSCIDFSKDDNDKCEGWAEEGECTNNPVYIHVHCPRSCKMAIAWSPWVRNTLGLEDPPHFEPDSVVGIQGEPCAGQPVDAFSAAKIMHTRVERLLAGEYKSIQGFSIAAPTEYLGMLGVTEAILYAFRLYEIVIRTGLASASKSSEEDLAREATLNAERIGFVISTLKDGYSSDNIMRKIPTWLDLLQDSALAAHNIVSELNKVPLDSYNYCDASTASPQLQELIPYFLGDKGDGAEPTHFSTELPSAQQKLLNGVLMPTMGLGTWMLQGRACFDAVTAAIAAGYRSIDTAQAYQNEANVGDAIKAAIDAGVVSRKELFIATKLSDPVDAGYANVKALIQRQLRDLQVSYIDLYMLHSPLPDKAIQAETWRALEELLAAGILRSIGVSNFDSSDLKELAATAKVMPMVVQNKADVYHVAKQLDNRGDPIVKYARENKILIVAYSSLSAYPFVMRPAEDPIIRSIAHARGLTEAQVLLKWSMQKGFAVIPRSSSPQRLQENMAALSGSPLSVQDMKLLETLQFLISSPVCVPGEQ